MKVFELSEDTKPLRVPGENLRLYLEKNCSIALDRAKQNYYIYRGRYTKTNDKVLLHKPYRSLRLSNKTPHNYYNLLLSNLENWREYPKRNRSIIGTTSLGYAEEYFGSVYVVFPFNNPKIGVCVDEDLWYSFPYLFNNIIFEEDHMEQFNKTLHAFLTIALARKINSRADKDITKLRELFKEVTNLWHTRREHLERRFEPFSSSAFLALNQMYFFFFEKFNGNIEAALSDLLDPNKNNFRLLTLSDFDVTKNKEVWLEAPSVLIDYKYFLSVRTEIL